VLLSLDGGVFICLQARGRASSYIAPMRDGGGELVDQSGARSVGKIPEFKFCAVRAEKAEIRSAAE